MGVLLPLNKLNFTTLVNLCAMNFIWHSAHDRGLLQFFYSRPAPGTCVVTYTSAKKGARKPLYLGIGRAMFYHYNFY